MSAWAGGVNSAQANSSGRSASAAARLSNGMLPIRLPARSAVVTRMIRAKSLDSGFRASRGPGTTTLCASHAARGRLVSGSLAYPELQHAPIIRAGHPEYESIQRGFLAGFGQVPDLGGDHATDGVVLLIGIIAAELLVELLDRRERIHQPFGVAGGHDQLRGCVNVVLVVNLADDFLEDVLDR